jgi:hypothetical protein
LQTKNNSSKNNYVYEDQCVDDDVYEKLVNLASIINPSKSVKKGTRKRNILVISNRSKKNKNH